ncbi:MAG: Rv3235 family protein [Actinomycetes bacterium]
MSAAPVTSQTEGRPARKPADPPPSVPDRPRRLRVVPAPSWEPPGRDPRPGPPPPPAATGVQGTLALAFVLPSGLDAEPSVPDLFLVPAPRRPWQCEDDDEAPELTARHELPDPRPWSARLVQAVVEVLAGGRPMTQLLRWVTPEVYAQLADRPPVDYSRGPGSPAGAARSLPARVEPGRRESVRSVHVCEPADGVAEIAIVVAGRARPRAVALRLEGLNGRWVCTALTLG